MCSSRPNQQRELPPLPDPPSIVIAAESRKTRQESQARRTSRSGLRVDVGAASPPSPGLTIGGSS